MDERAEYAAIMRKEVTRYKNLPQWRIVARTAQMGRVRTAAANLSYAGGDPKMPTPLRSTVGAKVAHWVTDPLPYMIFVVGVVLFFIGWGLKAIATHQPTPPKPLPAAIKQRGYSFYIPPNYVATKDYKNVEAESLCRRLPKWIDNASHHEDFEIKTHRNGVIEIHCLLDND